MQLFTGSSSHRRGTDCKWSEGRETSQGAATVVQVSVVRTRVLEEERATEDGWWKDLERGS